MLHNVKTFTSFSSPGYRFYFISMIGQWSSANMMMTAQALLVYRLTGSPALLGVISLASAIPTLLLSLYGGVVADRMSKKYLIQIGQVAAAVITLGIALALSSGYMSAEHPGSWRILLVSAVLQGIIMAFIMPARSAIIPELVRKDQVVNAVALGNMGMNTFQLISPAIAGFLIDSLGFHSVYFIMSGLILFAIVLTSFIPATHPSTSGGFHNPLTDVREGLTYIWSNTSVLLVLGFIMITMVLAMPLQILMPVFTDDILKVGATGLGVLMSVSGAGALVGSIIIASFPAKKRGAILLLASLMMGLVLAVFSFTRSWPLALATMAFFGLGRAGSQTASITLLQHLAAPEYMGRVMSILMMNIGLTSLGAFFAGVLAERLGVQWAVGGFSAALFLVSLAGYLFVPKMRNLD
jgi:MFS family permease